MVLNFSLASTLVCPSVEGNPLILSTPLIDRRTPYGWRLTIVLPQLNPPQKVQAKVLERVHRSGRRPKKASGGRRTKQVPNGGCLKMLVPGNSIFAKQTNQLP